MNFTFTHRPEARKFNYKPQFYVPEEKQSTNETNFDPNKFGEKLRSNWDRKRQTKSKRSSNSRIIIWMVFLIMVLGYIGYRYFVKN
ncbi:MAG: hypothetical protein FWC10_09290 [Lentimicrobiaceae bacterium]|nr:hypothetical protein [Lentimicrobiaceae bacterium]